ncbi:hypothetical protein ILUMI_18162, partial [Ignelater luminosus]
TAIRRKRKATILTDTPEKNALQEEQNKTTKKVKIQKQRIDKKRKKVFVKKFSSQVRKAIKMTMPAWFAAKPIPEVYQGKMNPVPSLQGMGTYKMCAKCWSYLRLH